MWVCFSCPADRVGFNTLWCTKQAEEEWQERLFGPYARIDVEGIAPSRQQFLDSFSKYEVVYFVGHNEETDLILTDVVEGSRILRSTRVKAAEVANRLLSEECRTKVLIINACRSSQVATEIYHRMAASEGHPLTPTIIAMQLDVPICYAFDFQRHVMPRLIFRADETISGAVARWRNQEDVAVTETPRDHPAWGIPTVFAPCGVDPSPEVLRKADALVGTQALIGSSRGEGCGPGPTVGPIGLNREQRSIVLDSIDAQFEGVVTLRGSFGSDDHGLPYREEVSIDPFLIDIYPVTNHLYDWFRENVDPEAPPRESSENDRSDHPARVTYEAAERYCERMGGRLPTRSEWERAARGTVYTILPWTEDTKAGLLANPMDKDHTLKCNVLYGMPKPLVSVFETSGGRTRWGSSFVADMIGNAAEWTGDLAKMEEAWVMGFGHTRPLVANIPSFARSVQMDAWFGFRCVTDFGNRL